MEYEAWLVDLDGTLYHPLPLKAAMAAELVLVGAGHIPTLRRFRHMHETVRKQRVTGGDPYRAQIERTAALLDRDPGEVSDLVEDWMQRRPSRWLGLLRRRGLLEEIRAHRARGGKTAIVSDYPAGRKLSALGVADLFDVVVASGEPDGPEQLKPDPAGYLLAAERLAVEPARCLVIGDRDDADGAAARAAGMAFRKV